MGHWVVSLLVHMGFNLIRMAYMMSRGVYGSLTGVSEKVANSKKPENYEWSAHVENIVYKHRMDFILEESGPQNFLTTHEGFAQPEEVLKDNYSLYCLTLDEAVFVEVPEGIDVCESKNGSFTKEAQYMFARRLYTMPIRSFHQLAEKIGDPQKPIIFLGNTSRCGSTLVAQIFERTGKIHCFSEPDGFDTLAVFVEKNMLPEKELARMVKNGMRILLKPIKKDITHYHIKITSFAMKLMPLMKQMYPDSVHLFMYREGMDVARSLALSADAMPMLKLAFKLGRIHESITAHVVDDMGLPPDKMFRERIKDETLFCYKVWAALCGHYLDFRNGGLGIKAIKYEELCADPTYSVTQIFKHAGLPQELVSLGVGAMKVNAHDKSVLNKGNVHKNPLPTMNPQFKDEAEAVRISFGIPPPPCVLPDTLTHKEL